MSLVRPSSTPLKRKWEKWGVIPTIGEKNPEADKQERPSYSQLEQELQLPAQDEWAGQTKGVFAIIKFINPSSSPLQLGE
jgi:hypothetical protein